MIAAQPWRQRSVAPRLTRNGRELALLAALVLGQAHAGEPDRVDRIDVAPATRDHGAIIRRPARVMPDRYVAIVLPGSGCAGLAPIADELFGGLLHANLRILHKVGVNPQAWPPPLACDESFVDSDHHLGTLQSATRALVSALADLPAKMPIVLIGMSEGAEFLPSLAEQLSDRSVLALVLVAHPGRDPTELGALQADRLQQAPRWQAAMDSARAAAPGAAAIEGRSVRYWQDLQQWLLWRPLVESGIPVVRAWGALDENIPPVTWTRTRDTHAVDRWWCDIEIPDADHGLRRANGRPGLPLVWALVEELARGPAPPDCASWQADKSRVPKGQIETSTAPLKPTP